MNALRWRACQTVPFRAGILRVCLAGCVLNAAVAMAQDGATLERRFAPLRTENPSRRGRDVIVADCQALLTAFPADPGRAAVMLRIARLYDLENPRAGFRADRPQALTWYRRAYEASEPQDPVGFEAGLALVRRLREQPDEVSNVKDGRVVLKELSQGREADPYQTLLLAAEEVYQSLAERDLPAAQKACDQLMSLSVENTSAPDGQIPVSMVRANAARELLFAVAQNGDAAPDERLRTVNGIAQTHEQIDGVDRSADAARQIIQGWKSVEPAESAPPAPAAPVSRRGTFLWINGIAICLLGLVVLFRRWGRSRQRPA